jgi:hypothetical protein
MVDLKTNAEQTENALSLSSCAPAAAACARKAKNGTGSIPLLSRTARWKSAMVSVPNVFPSTIPSCRKRCGRCGREQAVDVWFFKRFLFKKAQASNFSVHAFLHVTSDYLECQN